MSVCIFGIRFGTTLYIIPITVLRARWILVGHWQIVYVSLFTRLLGGFRHIRIRTPSCSHSPSTTEERLKYRPCSVVQQTRWNFVVGRFYKQNVKWCMYNMHSVMGTTLLSTVESPARWCVSPRTVYIWNDFRRRPCSVQLRYIIIREIIKIKKK